MHTVSRDRWNGYAEGIKAGAPTAIQVADRFHLLKNLSHLVMRVLQPHQAAIEQQWAHLTPTEAPSALIPLPPALREYTVHECARQNRIAQTH